MIWYLLGAAKRNTKESLIWRLLKSELDQLLILTYWPK